MGYSTGFFSKIGSFFKMAITHEILVGISSNFLQSIRTSICIRKIGLEKFLDKKNGLKF